jgi:hypothetical protein
MVGNGLRRTEALRYPGPHGEQTHPDGQHFDTWGSSDTLARKALDGALICLWDSAEQGHCRFAATRQAQACEPRRQRASRRVFFALDLGMSARVKL